MSDFSTRAVGPEKHHDKKTNMSSFVELDESTTDKFTKGKDV